MKPVSRGEIWSLSADQMALFKAYQANFLSLVSHELRTPLMGVINSVCALETLSELKNNEFSVMLSRNVERLRQTVESLLELAAMEGGYYNLRLKEVLPIPLWEQRLTHKKKVLDGRRLKVELDPSQAKRWILVDPQRFGRAMDLCLEMVLVYALADSKCFVRLSHEGLSCRFRIEPAKLGEWKRHWDESLVGVQSGMHGLGLAFLETMKPESLFLTRVQEGLGVALVLIHEIMKRHQGSFVSSVEEGEVELVLFLPQLPAGDRLKAALNSRLESVGGAPASVALGFIRPPQGESLEHFEEQVKRGLFRSSDLAMAVPEKRILALLLDDCDAEAAPKLMIRLEKLLSQKLNYSIVVAPNEGVESKTLFELAEQRLQG